MVKNVLRAIVFFSALLLSGCFGLWDSGSARITGKYIVLWIDLPQNQIIAKLG